MKRPENSERCNRFLSEMEAACAGTAWAWRPGFWGNVTIRPRLEFTEETLDQKYLNAGPNLYAPSIYYEEDAFGKEGWEFVIQTTSVGALNVSEIEKFTAALTDAVELVKKLTAIVAEYYEYD